MRRLAACAIFLLALCTISAHAEGGDLSFYSRTGIMDWKEKENGTQFIRETGPTQEVGLEYRFRLGFLAPELRVGAWGGLFDYDGQSAETGEPRKMTTGDAGIKGNLLIGIPFRFGPGIELGPVAGGGAEYFWRSVGPEYWTVFSALGGTRFRFSRFEVTAGMTLPLETSDTIDWTGIGAESKARVKPSGKASPFLEAKVALGKWDVGLFYEPRKWEASPHVPFSYAGSNPAAAIAGAKGIYQPDTKVEHAGISFSYHF